MKLSLTILCAVFALILGELCGLRSESASRSALEARGQHAGWSRDRAFQDRQGGNRSSARLQSRLNALMAGRLGDVIVSDPRTGEIAAAWNLESGLRDAYPPGSTVKIVESAAALEEGLITPQDRIYCRRVPPILGEKYHCVHPASRSGFTLPLALANSCNYYFAVLSLQLTPATLSHWYSVFGFSPPGAASPTAAERVIIEADVRRKALAALGEADVVATPAQVLEAYSAVATGGEFRRLWGPGEEQKAPLFARRIQLRPSTSAALIDGLAGCVEFGTCKEAAVAGVRVAGKTGTATALDGSGATHAWFAGFAPAEDPEIAIVVFLNRGTGAHSAAPLAGAILREYFAARNQ